MAYTHARSEALAEANLARQGFATYLPLCRRRISHARRTTEASEPLFPRYLFVGFDPATAQWRSILSTVGVIRLITDGATPVPVADEIVEAIRSRSDAEGFVTVAGHADLLRRGDQVSIAAGPLAQVDGIFLETNPKGRVMMLVSLMNRQIKVMVPTTCIDPGRS